MVVRLLTLNFTQNYFQSVNLKLGVKCQRYLWETNGDLANITKNGHLLFSGNSYHSPASNCTKSLCISKLLIDNHINILGWHLHWLKFYHFGPKIIIPSFQSCLYTCRSVLFEIKQLMYYLILLSLTFLGILESTSSFQLEFLAGKEKNVFLPCFEVITEDALFPHLRNVGMQGTLLSLISNLCKRNVTDIKQTSLVSQ